MDLLIQQLNDPDWQVRMHAADELTKHPDAKAVPALIDALGDEQYNVWTSAANALKAIGAPAVDALMAEMDDPDPRCRRMAAQVLGGIPGAPAQRGLHKALDDPDTIVRVNAISGIAGARNLDREDLQNRVSLLINVIIEDPNELVWSNAADALAKIKDHAAQQTLIYAPGPGSQGARWRLAQALGKTQNADAVMPLLRALHDVDTQVRRAAASALGELGSFGGGSDRFAVTGLLNGLRDPDAKVRANVALALGKMHDDGAVEPLIGALSDPDSETRASAAQALGMLRDDRAVESLIAAMKDPNIYVRINAANAVTAASPPTPASLPAPSTAAFPTKKFSSKP
ncbi:MAG: HEAT repeat domain-containing protein [Acidobacteriaceae bacterium]